MAYSDEIGGLSAEALPVAYSDEIGGVGADALPVAYSAGNGRLVDLDFDCGVFRRQIGFGAEVCI